MKDVFDDGMEGIGEGLLVGYLVLANMIIATCGLPLWVVGMTVIASVILAYLSIKLLRKERD